MCKIRSGTAWPACRATRYVMAVDNVAPTSYNFGGQSNVAMTADIVAALTTWNDATIGATGMWEVACSLCGSRHAQFLVTSADGVLTAAECTLNSCNRLVWSSIDFHWPAVASSAMGHWGTCPLNFQQFHFSSLWSKSDSQLSEYCVVCEISWCRCRQLTALSIGTALVTKLLTISHWAVAAPGLEVRRECPMTLFPALPLLATNPGDATADQSI